MMTSVASCPILCPTQAELDGFLRAGVNILVLATPTAMMVALGDVGSDGRFDADPTGHRWFTFEESDPNDIVFWDSTMGRLASWSGRAFALGQEVINLSGTYSFD